MDKRIKVVGYNIHVDNMYKFGTPETICAAYARISRSPKTIEELHMEAEKNVAKARESNERIVFGMGHGSIAEHAVLNFDMCGISRLAMEFIQKRLISFTEKSQRYVKLTNDFVTPKEISDIYLSLCFEETIKEQYKAYSEIYAKLVQAGMKEEEAKEDARYVLSLATMTQAGMTINARRLENLIMSLNSSGIDELISISKELYDEASKVVPSLIRYTDPTPYVEKSSIKMLEYARKHITPICGLYDTSSDVRLISYPKNGDVKLIAYLLFGVGVGSYPVCYHQAKKMTKLERERFVFCSLKDLGVHDSMMKEYETLDVIFELKLSASCYAQMKRHRITTQIITDYNIDLGTTIPPSIREHCPEIFYKVIAQTESLYDQLWIKYGPKVASYILTNAHRRKMILKTNLRELYHISRLRQDEHAQWDIRNITNQIVAKVSKRIPLATKLMCGKHEFGGLDGGAQ